jgi:hypothetical protein
MNGQLMLDEESEIKNTRYWPKTEGLTDFELLIRNLEHLNNEILDTCSRQFHADMKKFQLFLAREKKVINGNNKYIFGKKSLGALIKLHIDHHTSRLCSQISSDISLHLPSEVCLKYFKPNRFFFTFTKVLGQSYDKYLGTPNLQCKTNYQELNYIHLIMLILVEYIRSDVPPTFCDICFRRTLSKKYCHHHKSTSSKFYLNGKKIIPYRENKEFQALIEYRDNRYRYRGLREQYASESIDKLNHKYWAFHFVEFLSPIPNIKRQIIALCGDGWDGSDTSESVANLLSTSFSSFYMCINKLYMSKEFDNRYEKDFAPFAVMTTLYLAEAWLSAFNTLGAEKDARIKNNVDRDELILQLSNNGFTVRTIATTLNEKGITVGKTTVANVIAAKKVAIQIDVLARTQSDT